MLRGAKGGEEHIEATLTSLQKEGFVNYYGTQRFGDCASRNDDVTAEGLEPDPSLPMWSQVIREHHLS